jgi:hypothetical protein
MEWIVRAISENPLIAMVVCFSALLIFYFLFKSMIKLALIFIIVVVAIGGYLYFQHPESRPTDFKDAVEKARTGAHQAVDKGKEVYGKSKELIEKGKVAYEKGRELVDKGVDKGKDAAVKGKELIDKGKVVLDRGIDKGKEAVEKGKETADNIRNRMQGQEDTGVPRKP